MEELPMTERLQLVTHHDFGYSLQLPGSWRDVGPDIYNSAFEVARYLRNSPKIHDGIVNVFWDMPGESLQSLVEVGNPPIFDLSVESLRQEGITDISVSNVEIGGRQAIRLDWATPLGDINDWASRSYFMQIRDKFVCLNMGTSDRVGDCALYDQIANSFNAIEDTVGIVLVRDDSTPGAFVAEVLEKAFQYPQRKALQRSIRMNTQSESVVALIAETDAAQVIELVAEQSRQSGYGLTARIVGKVQ
tara:strand:- start:10324 stop:11064 length:741 start_codon:yes stop_codon:yes gene_type:complete